MSLDPWMLHKERTSERTARDAAQADDTSENITGAGDRELSYEDTEQTMDGGDPSLSMEIHPAFYIYRTLIILYQERKQSTNSSI